MQPEPQPPAELRRALEARRAENEALRERLSDARTRLGRSLSDLAHTREDLAEATRLAEAHAAEGERQRREVAALRRRLTAAETELARLRDCEEPRARRPRAS